jgi:hypothetical protein
MTAHAAAILVVLVVVGQALPPPAISDHEMMEYVGQGVINPGCTNLNCWRILAAAIVERFPGPSLPRWRTYAAIGNAGGAAMTGALALAFGLSPQAAILAMWISGMSVGSFTTVYHPYTSDSMIFFLAPLIMLLLVRGRIGVAALISAVGIFAKEFAAVPLFMQAVADGIAGEWARFRRGLALAAAVIVLWVGYQIGMMVLFHYAYDANPSIDLLRGGYFWFWYKHIGPVTALLTIFSAFGAAYLLAAAGFTRAPDRLRALVGGAVIPALAFMYVETPDRALFNFHFLVGPLAAIALVSAPVIAGWTFVAAYTLANLRIGSTWDAVPSSRYALAVSLAVACLAIVQMWGRSSASMVAAGPGFQKG